jgi:hypothetical protein
LVTVAGCYAAGAMLVRWSRAPLLKPERFPLAFVLGAACLHLALFLVMSAKLAYRPVVIAIPLVAIVLAVWTRAWRLPAEPAQRVSIPLRVLFGAIFAIFTLLYFFHAWAPEISPDGSGYHLGLVARYLRAHGFERVLTNMYASLSAGVEMLYVPAFAIGRHSAAALVHFAFTVAVALAIFAYGRRLRQPWAGATGAILMYACPVVGMDGTTAYIDVAVAAIAFVLFYWLEIWDERREPRMLISIGLLAGYCFASKYTAFPMALYAVGFVLWRSRKLKPALTVCAMAAVMAVPWLAKNWVTVQNPVAPFGNSVFRNPWVKVSFEQEYAKFMRDYSVDDKRTLPLEVTVRGQKTTGAIGATFLGAPLALLALRWRAGRRLVVAFVMLAALYYTNIGTRFLIPTLPFLSMAMALALSNVRVLLGALAVFHAFACWPSYLRLYTGPNVWALEPKILWKQALRKVPQDDYLHRVSWGFDIARMVQREVPQGEIVLAENGLPESYTTREVAVGFQSGIATVWSDILYNGFDENTQPRSEWVWKFPERSMRQLRIVQTAACEWPEQWNAHEVRFFSQGRELSRDPVWRLTAFPNPWEVQMAFDNSDATRWRTWETCAPGNFIAVDFGRDVAIDEVRVATSRDHVKAALRLEGIAAEPQERTIEPRGSVRRAATSELHLRGVNYMLLRDTEWGAEDIADDPEGWGLQKIAKEHDATLYKVIP